MELPQIAFIHLIAGTVTVLAGSIALISRKGFSVHRFAGNLFVACMIALSLSGLYLSYTRSILFTAFLAMLALYLVVTGWAAAKRRDGTIGVLEKAAMAGIFLGGVASALAGYLAPAIDAPPQDVPPAEAFYVVTALALFFGMLDMFVVRRGGVSGKNRIARHVWRMGFSMFIAATIFFLGNNSILPEFFRQPVFLYTPILAVVVLTVFWLCRVLLSDGRAGPRVRAGAGADVGSDVEKTQRRGVG